MDEYTSEIFMGGRNTIVMHNTCEDSLLAAPLILDLVLLAELCTRIEFKKDGEVISTFLLLIILFCVGFQAISSSLWAFNYQKNRLQMCPEIRPKKKENKEIYVQLGELCFHEFFCDSLKKI